jgi:glycosyltransferase involved in cell wall biosynthesis
MRIGVDFYSFNPEQSGGIHTFAQGLLKGLLGNLQAADSVVVIVSKRNEKQMRALLSGLPVTFITIAVGGGYRYINRALWLLAWAVGNFKLRFWYEKYFRPQLMGRIDAALDVMVVPGTVASFYALKTPAILCIHDIQQEYHPEWFSLNQRSLRWASYRLSCWRAAAIQASSHYIKNCVIEKFEFIRPDKVFIAHEGVDLDKFSTAIPGERPEQMGAVADDSFVFYPAQLWPHKNHLLLIEALAVFRDKTGKELPCVLTGYDYGHWGQIEERIKVLKLEQVYYLGRVSFAQILWLYRNCRAVLALGLHESSSLPVREGAVFGKPLICSDIPPNIETREFLHLEIFDRTNPTDLADVFIKLVKNDGAMCGQAAENVSRVKVFDWNNVAKKYIAVLGGLEKH